MGKRTLVTTTDIKNYIYCQCCWWDEFEGLTVTTTKMEIGDIDHQNRALVTTIFELLKKLALLLIIVGLLGLLGYFTVNFILNKPI